MAPDEYTMWLERELAGKNVEELTRSHEILIEKVKRIDPLTIADETDAKYIGEGVPHILIPFLHSWFVLDLLPYRIRAQHKSLDTLPMKVLVLQHFVSAAENQGTAVRVMGQWIDTRSLRHGAVMGAHFSKTSDELLGRFFALPQEQRVARVLKWAGVPADLADESYIFRFFPRLPVAFVNWKGDNEFPQFSKILYDVSASNYMTTHGLAALTEFLIFRLAEDS
ncbi:MAG: DUF3786 domain-containing protein [Desulfomonile tiedjei]|uniref:DUF3786 domain-containing protein n=1 Tax=Desulfomonile tiedjei TaxID=2358 RepID=A0A9D6V3J1_9BACT|nr:DUF3786 domain-containing protein [Desulfomonile tiedjei]